MKKEIFVTLFATVILTVGVTFSSYAEEVFLRDEEGNGYYTEVPDEVNGLLFVEYVDASDTIIYGCKSEIPYEWDYFLYDANTLQPVEGWYVYDERKDIFTDADYKVWMYAVPGTSGSMVRNSWVLDNGLVYLINSRGTTKHNEIIQFSNLSGVTTDVIYNVQTGIWEPLPYSQNGNEHHLAIPYNGTVTFEDFVKTLSGENYEAWLAEWNQRQAELEKEREELEASVDWSMFDPYISQAMAEQGYSSYELIGRDRITQTLAYVVGIYKVKVGSSTKYLNIYINKGIYTYAYSSL